MLGKSWLLFMFFQIVKEGKKSNRLINSCIQGTSTLLQKHVELLDIRLLRSSHADKCKHRDHNTCGQGSPWQGGAGTSSCTTSVGGFGSSSPIFLSCCGQTWTCSSCGKRPRRTCATSPWSRVTAVTLCGCPPPLPRYFHGTSIDLGAA